MRICYLGDIRSPFLTRPAKWLADQGHEVHLITQRPRRVTSRRIRVHVAALPRRQRIPLLGGWFKWLRLRRLLAAIQPDVVHCHYALSSAMPLLAARGRPTVLTLYGSDLYRARGAVGRLTALTALLLVGVVTTSSLELRHYAVSHFGIHPGKFVQLRWGLDLKVFYPRSRAREALARRYGLTASHFIFSPRGLQPLYNPQRLLATLPALLERFPEARVVLLRKHYPGEPPLAALPAAARKQVTVINRILTPGEMALFTSAADVTVSLATSDQMSACVLQAMACGSIPVVSDLPVYRRVITPGENGFLVDPQDVARLTAILGDCLAQGEDLRARMKERNRRLVAQEFDQAAWLPKLEQLYRKTVRSEKNA